MAEKKSGNAKKLGSGLLLGLLAISLIGFGAVNFSGNTQSIGTVGEEELDIGAYGRGLQNAIRAQEAETGISLTFLQAQAIGIPAQVRSQMIADAALDDKVRQMGLSVGDEEVRNQVLEYPAFQGVDGKFDREAYSFTLENAGLNEAEFEDLIRKETARSMLQSAVIAGIEPSDQLVDTMFNFLAARRSYNLITLTADSLAEGPAEPTEAELQAYYEANAPAFTTPEARDISFAWLTPDMVVDTVEVDEALLRELFNQRIDEFLQPERRLVERLVFPDQTAADEAAARLDAGEVTFDELVAERGLDLGDVDLGDVEISDLGAAGSAVFGMAEPGVTGPHASDFGPALFRMNAVLAAQETAFDDVRDDLKLEASLDQAGRIIADMMLDIDDRLAAGATLEDLADETEMQLGQIAYHAGVSDGIAAYDAFREAAIVLRESDFPELIELDDGGIFAARLDGTTSPRLLPIEEVRDRVIDGWTIAETTQLLETEAESIKTSLESGADSISVGHPVEFFDGLTRNGVSPVILSEDLFEAELGGVVTASIEGQVFVAHVKDILPPDESDPSTNLLRQIWEQQSAQGVSQDLFSMFSQAMLDEAGLTLNQAAIDAVHTQFLQ